MPASLPGSDFGLPQSELFMKLQYSGEAAKSFSTGIRPAVRSTRPFARLCSA